MAKRRELTQIEIAAAERLKAHFVATKKEHKLTYEKAAAKLDWTAGNFSQYLNSMIPLNMPALIAICSVLPRANPIDIYPELFDGTGISFNHDDSDEQLLADFKMLSEDLQQAIRAIIASNRRP